MSKIKLEARNIALEYGVHTAGRLVALADINLTIHENEFVSIVGPSGCGKTTFLSVVDGLIPATGGQILVDGKLVTKPGPDRAVVFQDFLAAALAHGAQECRLRSRMRGREDTGSPGEGYPFHRNGRPQRL